MSNLINDTIHFVLQSKGGAGKSVVATLLAQYLNIETNGNLSIIDTDPNNKTLGAFKELNAEMVNVIGENKVVDQSKFDSFINDFASASKTMLVDTGSCDFLTINTYLLENDLPMLLSDIGKKMVIHCPVNFGQSKSDTIKCLIALASNFSEVPIIVWQNEFWGTADSDLETLPILKKHKNIVGIVKISKMNGDTDEKNFSEMLKSNLTFNEVASSQDARFGFIEKTRLKRIQSSINGQLDSVFTVQD